MYPLHALFQANEELEEKIRREGQEAVLIDANMVESKTTEDNEADEDGNVSIFASCVCFTDASFADYCFILFVRMKATKKWMNQPMVTAE